jgi:hypothetical protein
MSLYLYRLQIKWGYKKNPFTILFRNPIISSETGHFCDRKLSVIDVFMDTKVLAMQEMNLSVTYTKMNYLSL